MNKRILKKEPLSAIIAGVGGQGNILLSSLLGSALVNEGFMVSVADTYGVSQRGGSVASHIKISKTTLYSSVTLKGQADVILGMEPVETLRVLGEFGNPDFIIIANPRPIYPSGEVKYPDPGELQDVITGFSAKASFVYATEEALRMGNPLYTNIILLGSLLGAEILPITKEAIISVLEERFSNDILEPNIRALEKGIELIS